MTKHLPTVNFACSGKVDAAHAAYLFDTPNDCEVRVRHPHGGYICVGVWPTAGRDFAKEVASQLNATMGEWAAL